MANVTRGRQDATPVANGDAGRIEPPRDELRGGIRGGRGRMAAVCPDAEPDREGAALEGAREAVVGLVPQAERDASRRGALFGAIRRAVALSPMAGPRDAEAAVLMATVLLDAGRPVATSEVARRVGERWGERAGESALYAAKFSGAMGEDYGVLYLERPVEGGGADMAWMYEALERAVELGAARYTDGGIEMTGAGAALAGRDLAGAEAVARGVSAYGEPPGLAEWLDRDLGDTRRVTWAEATVAARGARAEVLAAWERIAGARGPAPAAARG